MTVLKATPLFHSRLSVLLCGAARAAAILVSGTASAAEADQAGEAVAPAGIESPGDIVVTAQRRDETSSRVPISIASFSQATMDKQGIRKIDDISRLAPALYFAPSSGANANNGTNISIRGVSSEVGSATTAVYIDDTPIQIRNVSYLGGNPYPRIFDLERVEILRGPQGTLFGAGAEGGAVRFITPQPSFSRTSIYGRAEVSATENGAESYEAGLALGAPISDSVAVRASAWYRKDGGYIDQATQGTNNVIRKDVNSQQSIVTRAAITFKPTEALSITPSIFYQDLKVRAQDQYWEGYGRESDADYITGVFNLEPTRDKLLLPALKVEYGFGEVSLISNTSYFKRTLDQRFNYLTYQSFLRTGNPFGVFSAKDPTNSDVFLDSKQTNFVQEVRLFSTGTGPISWLIGAYYSKTKQDFSNFTSSGRTPGVLSGGFPQLQGRYSYFESSKADDEQLAGYANIDFTPVERLKLSVSARYSHNKFSFENTTDGPIVSNIRSTIVSNASENSFTPKFTATFQATPTNMVYVTASKGFRPGGAQPQVNPDFCARDLALLGIARSPTDYDSDTLWNYEAGTKNKFLDNRLQLDLSVYRIKWKNIQQSINLPFCNLNYVGNLGSATGKGLELTVSVTPITGLQIGTNLAYTRITFDSDQSIGTNRLVAKGQRFGGPKWTAVMFGEYAQPVSGETSLYGRVDYSFARSKSPLTVPGTFGYDPAVALLPDTDFVSARIGTRFRGFDISLFVDNLTNSTDPISRGHDGLGAPLFYAQSFRPRTFGLTGQYRY